MRLWAPWSNALTGCSREKWTESGVAYNGYLVEALREPKIAPEAVDESFGEGAFGGEILLWWSWKSDSKPLVGPLCVRSVERRIGGQAGRGRGDGRGRGGKGAQEGEGRREGEEKRRAEGQWQQGCEIAHCSGADRGEEGVDQGSRKGTATPFSPLASTGGPAIVL